MYSGFMSIWPLSSAAAVTFRAPAPIPARSTVYPLASRTWA
jgi:hypothetical protein